MKAILPWRILGGCLLLTAALHSLAVLAQEPAPKKGPTWLLPVPELDRAYLRSIRRGERPLAEVLDAIAGAEARLTDLRDSPAIPDQPDRRWVDDWLYRSYQDFWARRD